MATINYKVNGSFPPFSVELRSGSVDGIIIDTMVALSADTEYSFTGVPDSGDFFVVAYDNAFGRDSASTGFTTTTTTTTTTTSTTTTTTTSTSTTTTTTTVAPTTTTTTTTTTLPPTTTTTTTVVIGTPAPVTTGDTYVTLNSFYAYPSFVIDFGAAFAGKTSTTVLEPFGNTPNRFTVRRYSDNGIVISTGWVGDAIYSGPWGFADAGSPYSNPANPSYPLALTERYYTFEVETVTGPTFTDNWNWSIPAGV
jgi:hypothetical protein